MTERREDEEHAAPAPDERRLEDEVEARREGAPGYDMAEEEAYKEAEEEGD